MFRRGSLLGEELTAWQFDCFAWLLRHTGGLSALRQHRLIQPTTQHFPQRGVVGHALAAALFAQVMTYAGMSGWPCTLEMQEGDPDALVAPTLLVKGAPSSPAGTFRRGDDGVVVTYNPASLSDPMSLVATFAHELAHYRTAGFDEPPPGGWEVWEPATDLAATFLGFGLFLANSRFSFSQHMDHQSQGWKWRQQGYLSEPEILHAHAIFSALLDIPAADTLSYLKPSLRGIYKRVLKDVGQQAEAMARLRTAS
jgi:hypothetical protein